MIIDITVTPKASRPKVGPIHNGRLKVAVSAPPVDGKANEAVVEVLAQWADVPRRCVTIVAGEASRHKRVSIETLSEQRLQALYSAAK